MLPLLIPLDFKRVKKNLQLPINLLARPRRRRRDFQRPIVPVAVHPTNLPQRHLLVHIDVVHPQAAADGTLVGLDADGDTFSPSLDVVGSRRRGDDTPVSPGVAGDDGEARRVVEALDSGLDPFALAGGGREGEEEAALVVLLDVGGGEG